MQTVTISRKKDAEVDDWAADKEPGDRVCLYGTIKSLDDQTLVVTVEEVEDDDRDDDDDRSAGGNQGSDAVATNSPGSLASVDSEGSPV
jgi:hypothetical protein